MGYTKKSKTATEIQMETENYARQMQTARDYQREFEARNRYYEMANDAFGGNQKQAYDSKAMWRILESFMSPPSANPHSKPKEIKPKKELVKYLEVFSQYAK